MCPPPVDSWRSTFARLALERAADLQRLADELAG